MLSYTGVALALRSYADSVVLVPSGVSVPASQALDHCKQQRWCSGATAPISSASCAPIEHCGAQSVQGLAEGVSEACQRCNGEHRGVVTANSHRVKS